MEIKSSHIRKDVVGKIREEPKTGHACVRAYICVYVCRSIMCIYVSMYLLRYSKTQDVRRPHYKWNLFHMTQSMMILFLDSSYLKPLGG